MKNGKIDAAKVDTSGKSLWARFVQALNSFFNPSHAWFDYSTWKDADSGYLDNLLKGWTQSGVTAQQSGLNEMQMQNVEDIYQRQVSGMQKAGLNPALMYQSGASSAPSAPSGTSMAGASMSDLMQLFLLPANRRLLEAQTDNVKAAADHMAQAAWLGYQKTFAQTHGVLLSGSPLIAIASMMSHSLSNILGIRENGSDGSKPSVEQVVSGAVGKLKEHSKEKPRLKRQEEVDFHERWSKMSRWQRFRYTMEHMD